MKPILEEAKALLEREPRFDEDQWAMLQPLLRDPYAYLRLDAAGFLQPVYPRESIAVLEQLLTHANARIRADARECLAEMGSDTAGAQ